MKFSFTMITTHNRQFLPYIIYLFIIGWVESALAQCPQTTQFGSQWVEGSFGIAGTEVGTQCTGRSITVVTPPTVTKARYIYDYKNIADTAKATSQTSFTYTQPGYYYIVQLGTVDGKPSIICSPIDVRASTKPTFALSSACGDSVKMTINATGLAFGKYLIDWGEGKPAQVYFFGQDSPTYVYMKPGSYQIKVTGEGTAGLIGCSAISDPQTFDVLQDPVPITTALATVKDDKFGNVTVTLPNTVKTKNYSFNRNGSEVLRINNVLTDSATNTSQGSVCYQVSYTDICDHKPPTTPTVCTIYLEVKGEMLQWSSQSPFLVPVGTYIVEKIDENGQVITTYSVSNSTEWLIDINDTDPEVIYRIKATTSTGQSSISNTFRYGRSPKLFVPDTFSPNNDLLNDTFEIKGQSINKGEITIYDRWGNVLYYTNEWTGGWDGTDAHGRKVNAGYYTYRIDYTDNRNKSYSKLGTVNLLR